MPYYEWFQAKYGRQEFLDLYNEWKKICKWKDYELEELYEKLKKEYSRL